MEFDMFTFDKRCYDEFWSKNLDILENIRREAVPLEQAWKSIADFLTSLETDYPESNVLICSDNPAFDLTFIDYNLFTRLGRLGVRYSDSGKYRCVSDPTAQRHFHPQKALLKQRLFESGAKHTHMPDDDAEGIYLQQVMLESPKMIEGEKELPKLLTGLSSNLTNLITNTNNDPNSVD
jgi:hypothetical protein